MNGWSIWNTSRKAAWSLALSLGLGGLAHAQSPGSLPPYNPASRSTPLVPARPAILQQAPEAFKETPSEVTEPKPAPAPAAPAVVEPLPAADCPTCSRRGGGLFGHGGGCASGSCGSGGCGSGRCVNDTCGPMPCYGCGYGGCFPGHKNCCPIDEHCGPFHRFFACVYHCICCPDPCYEPRWIVEANSAFWVDYARPVTQTRIRYDSINNFTQFDRSTFFSAKTGAAGPFQIDANALYFYQEASTGRASFFIEQAYLGVSPDDPVIGGQAGGSGFGDMNLGTKALLFDCELMQVTFQFRTYLPVGNQAKFLGTGHVSLEPSLLTAVKLLPETWFQGQLSEWIPIGASDQAFAGSVLHYHMAVNHVLYRCTPDIPIIGTIEANGYSFQDGQYTVPGGVASSSGETWWTAGPGIRMSICNRIDFGFSGVFGLAQDGPEQIYRTEFRMRF